MNFLDYYLLFLGKIVVVLVWSVVYAVKKLENFFCFSSFLLYICTVINYCYE